MLKQVQLFLLLLCSALYSLPVTKSFARARENGVAYQKPILVLFTGSDWSHDSQLLIEQLENKELQNKLGTDWIICHIDFPEINGQTQEELEQNFAIKSALAVETLPTIALLSPDGEEVGRVGYMPVAPSFFAQTVREMYTTYQSIEHSLQNASERMLQTFLLDARKLNNKALTHRIIEEGLTRKNPAVFALEKYHMLKDKSTDEAIELLQLAKAHTHILDARAQERLAWDLFEKEKGKAPLERARPLIQYANHQKEGKLVWKLHSFLARYLHDAGEQKKASEHAEKAEQFAPAPLKKDLEDLISSE